MRAAVWLDLLFALLATAAATALGFAIYGAGLPIANISVAYLVAVLMVGIRTRLWAAIFASFTSFLCFNFFFTEPRFTLAITDPHNLLTVVFYLIAAVTVSNLTARLKHQMEATHEAARRTANLYAFAQSMTAAVTREDVLRAVVDHVASTFEACAAVLLPGEGGLAIAASHPPGDGLDDATMASAASVWTDDQSPGRGTAGPERLLLPLRTARIRAGVLVVRMKAEAGPPSPDAMRLLEALADQAAAAIERTMLVADFEAARVKAERERLRSALLSSLSHDLRTPLVSIMGAASSIVALDAELGPDNRRDLAQTIQEEAERLNRFVQNLLDMTKLGSGDLNPRVDWTDLGDVIAAAVGRSRPLARGHAVKVVIDPAMPLLRLDTVLMEQVFFNLIDNACKYAPAGTLVMVSAQQAADHIAIAVTDQGPGIPSKDRERVFDMFTRVGHADSQPAGTGLGLAICRGIVEAHGGTIRAESGAGGVGTAISIHLPLPPHPPPTQEGPA
ncbi:MAG: DUF4118 domain-containing protein [Solirubrobacterales bacterium]